MKNKNKNYMMIISIMILFLMIFVPTFNVIGAINPETPMGSELVGSVFGTLLKVGTGPLTMAVSTLINAVLIIVLVLLYFLFAPLTNAIFPFPDYIIFNQVPFFDPNFINPTINDATKGSPVVLLQGLMQSMYYTSFVIAAALMIIAAMVIGVKLAMTSIASDKAHYKKAMVVWVTGLTLLFVTHFIMLFVFTLNENIVHSLSNASAQVEFELDIIASIPIVGKAISTVANSVKEFFTGSQVPLASEKLPGYGGMLIMFAGHALVGDLTSSIVCGIILMQTVILIIMYLKRLFYSFILGMIAPLIVAADVIKKSI